MLSGLGEVCDPKLWIAALSSPTINHFNSLCVDKQATKRYFMNIQILAHVKFGLPVASEPFFLDREVGLESSVNLIYNETYRDLPICVVEDFVPMNLNG